MDPILKSFLAAQWRDWEATLAPQTDLVDLVPLEPTEACRRYLAHFKTKGLVKEGGTISERESWLVGIQFGEEHLRRVEPLHLVTLLEPSSAWHPNITYPGVGVCVGRVGVGTTLVDLLYQIHHILSYQNYSVGDCLNPAAADWARENQERFPIDPRPLKRRTFSLTVKEVAPCA